MYNTGEISGEKGIGGIIGQSLYIKEKETHTTFIYNSYNKGKILGVKESIGGIAGIANCGTDVYYCVNTTPEISGTRYIGSIMGLVYGSYYSYTRTDTCYYNGSLAVIGGGKGTVSNCTSFTDEIDGNFMLETLKTNLSQVEWNGKLVDVWKVTEGNEGEPILYWE